MAPMTPAPRSRQDLQRDTRDALVVAARAVFAETGYHAATLEAIAREGGYSKGAVYSNFSSKADLFLAVMQANMEAADHAGGWEVPGPSVAKEVGAEPLSEEFEQAIRGMALATLEFVAAAARDPELQPRMAALLTALVERYAAAADVEASEGDRLSSPERGALLAALDQGTALLMLGGVEVVDEQVLRTGLRRLLVPRPEEAPRAGERGAPALHDDATRHRLAAAARADGLESPPPPP